MRLLFPPRPNIYCGYSEWSQRIMMDCPPIAHFITSKEQLVKDVLELINPKVIYFFHWSWIVPKEIVNNFLCINFHASDLPKFRGGAPIENQIKRGVLDTKLTAHIMEEQIDAGPILMKWNLSLRGQKSDIISRIEGMIPSMVHILDTSPWQFTEQDLSQGSFYTRADAE